MLRELTLAAALIAFVALLAFGFSRLHSLTPAPVKPTPRPTAAAIPWTPTPMVLPSAAAQFVTPEQAATWIGHRLTSAGPLLLPTAIGDDYMAELLADPHSFAVDYSNITRHATVDLATSQPVLPTPSPQGRRTMPVFRGVVATYQVDDATPGSPRWLLWIENGPNHGTPYSLIADGLTEGEFWEVANSLQPLKTGGAVRPCLAGDLSAAPGNGNGASGQVFNTVVFSNHSATACVLDGTPQVLLKTSSGTTLALPQVPMSTAWIQSSGPALMTPNSSEPQSVKMGFGQASLTFSMWDCPSQPAFTTITIMLPDNRGSLNIPARRAGYSWGGQCEGNVVQRMAVGPFVATEPPPNYVDSSPLSITITLPDHVRAGQALHYQVTLTNGSGAPFHFHDCPSYTEDASRPGFKNLANYQLNCGAVGWLAPSASVTFAMVLDTPADMPLGPGDLRWTMRSAYGGGEARGSINITAP